MTEEPNVYEKDEAGMSDYQFKAYERLRDENDRKLQNDIDQKDEIIRCLKRELESAWGQTPNPGETGMTDYQFSAYVKLRDEAEKVKGELILQTLKVYADTGKSAADALAAVEAAIAK